MFLLHIEDTAFCEAQLGTLWPTSPAPCHYATLSLSVFPPQSLFLPFLPSLLPSLLSSSLHSFLPPPFFFFLNILPHRRLVGWGTTSLSLPLSSHLNSQNEDWMGNHESCLHSYLRNSSMLVCSIKSHLYSKLRLLYLKGDKREWKSGLPRNKDSPSKGGKIVNIRPAREKIHGSRRPETFLK